MIEKIEQQISDMLRNNKALSNQIEDNHRKEEQHLDEHEKLEVCWKPKKDVLKNRFAWFDASSVFFAGAMLKMIQKGFVRYEEFS